MGIYYDYLKMLIYIITFLFHQFLIKELKEYLVHYFYLYIMIDILKITIDKKTYEFINN